MQLTHRRTNPDDLIFAPEASPLTLSHVGPTMQNKHNTTSSFTHNTTGSQLSAPIDIPPLPKTLMSIEDIGGMQFVTIDCPDVRERQAGVLQDSICNLASHHNGRVTILMGKVANFSCAWINSLLVINTTCSSKGGTLTLTGLSQPATYMLKQMGLHKKLKIV